MCARRRLLGSGALALALSAGVSFLPNMALAQPQQVLRDGAESAAMHNAAYDRGLADSYTSPETTGSIAFTPLADQSGTATITVTVEDGGLDSDLNTTNDNLTFSRAFDVTVNPINDDPTLDALSDLTIDEDAPQLTVDLTGIEDGDDGLQPLWVTATSSNLDLIPEPVVTYTSANATGNIAFTPVADQNGTTTITVTVEDGGLANCLLYTSDAADE